VETRLAARGLLREARPGLRLGASPDAEFRAVALDASRAPRAVPRARTVDSGPPRRSRSRRWAALALTAAVCLAAFAVSRGPAPNDEQRARVACAAVGRLRTDLSNGVLSGPAVASRLRLVSDAASGTEQVDQAVRGIAAAGPPASPAFQAAITAAADVCRDR
jgi:hypothetical protein